MPMKDDLRRILVTTSSLPEGIVAHVEGLECIAMDNFAHWAVVVEDAVTALFQGTDMGTRPNLARMRSAIAKARAQVDKANEREAAGFNEEQPDEPLRAEEQLELETRYQSTYSLTSIDADTMGSDLLVGRHKREFQRYAPSPFDVGKLRSRADARGDKARKVERLSNRFSFLVDAPAEAAGSTKCPFTWFENLEGLTNTWSLAGCFKVSYQAPGAATATELFFVHRDQSHSYYRLFKKKFMELRRVFTERRCGDEDSRCCYEPLSVKRAHAIRLSAQTRSHRGGHGLASGEHLAR